MPPEPVLTAAEFQAQTGVSRETLARLDRYAEILRRWQPTINLVARATLDDLWRRHMLDSAQVLPLLPAHGPIVDLGSGAGFPGLVLAVLGAPDVHLVEADSRKAAFLREAARAAGAVVTIHNTRIEAVSLTAAAVTARALAPLDRLLHYAARILKPTGRAVLLKGAAWSAEVADARAAWHFTCTPTPSRTDPAGAILTLESIRHG